MSIVMTRPLAAVCVMLLLAACDVTPKSVTVCETVVIIPALHDANSYDRLHYRIVPASENTIDVQITFRARDAEGRTFRETEECNLPKDAAFSEQEARAHLEKRKRAAAEAEAKSAVKQETPNLEEQQQKYHDTMEARTKRLLQADDDEGKAILRELQELMTIDKEGYERKKEGYEGAPPKPAESKLAE